MSRDWMLFPICIMIPFRSVVWAESGGLYTEEQESGRFTGLVLLDIEKSQLPGVQIPDPWQTDTCIGNWFYDARADV